MQKSFGICLVMFRGREETECDFIVCWIKRSSHFVSNALKGLRLVSFWNSLNQSSLVAFYCIKKKTNLTKQNANVSNRTISINPFRNSFGKEVFWKSNSTWTDFFRSPFPVFLSRKHREQCFWKSSKLLAGDQLPR